MRASIRIVGFAVALVGAPVSVRAAPGDDLPSSSDAALMGGAALASGTSAGSLWYNPAVLGRIRYAETEANAEAIGVRFTRVDGIAQLQMPDGTRTQIDVDDSQLVAVPTVFASAFTLSKNLTVGFGLYTPRAERVSAVTTEQQPDATGQPTLVQLRAQRSVERILANLGVGYQPLPNLQLGAAVVMGLETGEDDRSIFLSRPTAAGGNLTSFIDERRESTAFGLGGAIGLRGKIGRLVHGAATLRTPTYLATESEEITRTVSHRTGDDTRDEVVSELAPSGRTQLDGWRVGTGVSVGNQRVLGALDVEGSVGSTTRSRTGAASISTRLGAKVNVTRTAAVGGGAFYRSPDTSDDAFGATRLHLIGGSLGVELRRRLELRNQGAIEFRTVLAAWYAHGQGTTRALRLVSTDEAPYLTSSTYDARTRTDLIVVHVGSSLSF